MILFKSKSIQAYFCALFAVFIWGVFPTLIKGSLEFASIEQLLLIRFLVASLLYSFFLRTVLRKIFLFDKKWLILFSIVTISVFFSQSYALAYIPANWYIASFTFVPIIFLIIYKEPFNWLGKLGFLIAILGMGLFFITAKHVFNVTPLSILLLLVSIISWIVYSMLTKKLHNYFNDYELVALTSYIGFLSSLIFGGVKGFNWHNLPVSGVVLSCFSGVVLPIALTAYSFSLRIKPTFAVLSQYLEPVFGLLVAVIFLSEQMLLFQYIAASIIILGTFLVGTGSVKPEAN